MTTGFRQAIFILVFILFSWLSYDALQDHANSYLQYKSFDIVYVQKGDSLWKIASYYVTDHDDIRNLIVAIREINSIDQQAQLYPGQVLKIPVNTPQSSSYVSYNH